MKIKYIHMKINQKTKEKVKANKYPNVRKESTLNAQN